MLNKCIITDTSCLIVLQKIGRLDILNLLYETVLITPKIREEYGDDLPEWIKIQNFQSQEIYEIFVNLVDEGEATALSLAWEMKGSTVVLDDLKARQTAIKLGFKVTGTLGVLIKAKKIGLFASLKTEIDKMIKTNFRINSNIIQQALKEVGE